MTQAEIIKTLILQGRGKVEHQDPYSWDTVVAKVTFNDGSVLYIDTLCNFPRQLDTA